jgi:hypothetical protein
MAKAKKESAAPSAEALRANMRAAFKACSEGGGAAAQRGRAAKASVEAYFIAGFTAEQTAEVAAAELTLVNTEFQAAHPRPATKEERDATGWRNLYMGHVANVAQRADEALKPRGFRVLPSQTKTAVTFEKILVTPDAALNKAAIKAIMDAIKRLPKECLTDENREGIMGAWATHKLTAKTREESRAEKAAKAAA